MMQLLPLQIDLYVKPLCEFCQKAEELVIRYHLPTTLHTIGKDISRDDVLALFPGASILPIVVINGQLLGNYPQFIKWVAVTDFSKYQTMEKT